MRGSEPVGPSSASSSCSGLGFIRNVILTFPLVAQMVERKTEDLRVGVSKSPERTIKISPRGGTGRHSRFRIYCPKGRTGSSPVAGTKRDFDSGYHLGPDS